MILCIIPARYNSTRFPGKLLQVAQGKSILQRTYECASSCSAIDEIIIATDDERIAEHAKGFGANIVWTSSDCPNGTARIAQAINLTPRLQQASLVINLQGDHPCTSATTLEAIVKQLQADPEAEIATAARPIKSREDFLSPHVVKCVVDRQKRALYFSRAPIPYAVKGEPKALQHIGLYAYRVPFLLKMQSLHDTDLQQCEDLEQLKFIEWGYRIAVALVEDEALGIDTPQDLEQLNRLLQCQQNIFSSPAV